MSFDWWTLGLQTVNVLVLLWILSHFLFRPISEMLARRQAAATDDLAHARAARADAEAARADAQAQEAAVAARRADLLSSARQEAETTRRSLLEEARQEVETLRADAQAKAAQHRIAAVHALQDEAAELAADIAQRLLSRLPETARTEGFIDGLVAAISELPEHTRAGLGADAPLPVRAAAEMSAAETGSLAARLSEVLGHPVTLSVRSDPTLIAGLELDAPHAVVRNHLRADLDHIRQELLKHD
ncbi:F0F1 ATP synthase subunit delta [Salipiger mangrovisoli]|uniref:ATP synthase subunit b n=1 Tax=Salipiger mangrovisoli TaxID=2865933 RepID=A0ABR9WYI3_9RHOB|nr:F0F1 ATP synthase subunit delta [Salipiger mangrovisoli]MBE9636333.1 F0F1 ATP synthase subunit delta [Salipiger mangrovisoli]